ncbi:MAG: VWA domain-containing protein [Chromatiales bacterium]|jgi:Ca-activated chloride channel family protein
MQFEFAWPWLLTAVILPWLVYRLLPRANTHQVALLFPFYGMLQSLQHQQTLQQSKRGYRLLALFGWLLLVIAAARPQWIGESIHIPVSGRTMMLAVDISGSMTNEDMQLNGQPVSRLTAVKALAGEFIEQRSGDYLGLILFGRHAYLQAPLSYDRRTVRILLNEAAVGLAGKETAIGDAIGLAVKRLRKQPAENRILVLLTDGANTYGYVDPLKAADLAAQEGIRIYTIGVGDDHVMVPGFLGAQLLGNDLDEDTLKAIASKTSGRYFRARDSRQLRQIYALLDEIEPAADVSQTFRPVQELYAWPLALALAIAVVVAAMRNRYA